MSVFPSLCSLLTTHTDAIMFQYPIFKSTKKTIQAGKIFFFIAVFAKAQKYRTERLSSSALLTVSAIVLLAWHCRGRIQSFNLCYSLEVHQFKKAHTFSSGSMIIRRNAVMAFIKLTSWAWH